MHQLIQAKRFVGKTIKRIDASCINITRFFFTDGTAVAIEVENFGAVGCGMVQCAECVTDNPTEEGDEPPMSQATKKQADEIIKRLAQVQPHLLAALALAENGHI